MPELPAWLPPGDAPLVVADAGPWITLAYADALELLLVPGWPLVMVDMVLEELTRSDTLTSDRIATWVRGHGIAVLSTEVCRTAAGRRQRHLGEMAIQETMQTLALTAPARRAVFLFEDHKIARASFLLPPGCSRVTTRAWLLFLERRGWIESASAIERRALEAGRLFSRLRFPPD
ncbi:MAG: hypothetical protein ACKO6F_02955 [Cyanobium sp.]